MGLLHQRLGVGAVEAAVTATSAGTFTPAGPATAFMAPMKQAA